MTTIARYPTAADHVAVTTLAAFPRMFFAYHTSSRYLSPGSIASMIFVYVLPAVSVIPVTVCVPAGDVSAPTHTTRVLPAVTFRAELAIVVPVVAFHAFTSEKLTRFGPVNILNAAMAAL